MSKLIKSCSNCGNERSKPEEVIARADCEFLGQFVVVDTDAKAIDIARICSHYTNKQELCGTVSPEGDCMCEKETGHTGLHEASWVDDQGGHTSTWPELCVAKYAISPDGQLAHCCELLKYHKGPHRAGSLTWPRNTADTLRENLDRTKAIWDFWKPSPPAGPSLSLPSRGRSPPASYGLRSHPPGSANRLSPPVLKPRGSRLPPPPLLQARPQAV